MMMFYIIQHVTRHWARLKIEFAILVSAEKPFKPSLRRVALISGDMLGDLLGDILGDGLDDMLGAVPGKAALSSRRKKELRGTP